MSRYRRTRFDINSVFLSVFDFFFLDFLVIYLIILDQEDEESGQSLAGNVLYTTVQRRSKTIKTTDLLPVIKSLENNTDKGFCEEYHVRKICTLF